MPAEPTASLPDSVLFDLGGVLFRYLPERRLAHLAQITGLDGAIIHQAIWQSDFDQQCERGAMSAAESHQEFCRRLDIKISYTAYRDAMVLAFEPDPAVFQIARDLASRRHIAILTNNWETVEEALVARYPALGELFTGRLFFTWRLKGRKPDRTVFEACLKLWGKKAKEVLFVDDSEKNVTGSRAAGLHVHHYKDPAGLARALHAHGLA